MSDSAPAINPFAAPVFDAEPTNSKVEGYNRASERELRRLCNRLMVTDVSYALGCISFFGSFVLLSVLHSYGPEFQTFLAYLPWAFFAVTWVCLFSTHRVVQGAIGAIAVLITFPIPIFGTFVYRAESVHANVFLHHNGYKRTFLGGKPDPEERQRMAADPNHIPSVYFDDRGRRRRIRTFTLGDATIVGMIGFLLMSMILI